VAIVTVAATALNASAPKTLGPATLAFDFACEPGCFVAAPADDPVPAGPEELEPEEESPELELPEELMV